MLFEEERRQVLTAARETAGAGMNRGTSGNISVRTADPAVIAVTPSSLPYGEMEAEDVCLVGLDGAVVEARRNPSSELPLHLAVYRARPDVNAVVHTHALFSTVWSIAAREMPVMTVPVSEFAPIPTAPFALPGSEELAAAVTAALGAGSAVLMEHHGLLCACATLKKAMSAAAYVEENAQVALFARLLGAEGELPREAVAAMAARLRAGGAV